MAPSGERASCPTLRHVVNIYSHRIIESSKSAEIICCCAQKLGYVDMTYLSQRVYVNIYHSSLTEPLDGRSQVYTCIKKYSQDFSCAGALCSRLTF